MSPRPHPTAEPAPVRPLSVFVTVGMGPWPFDRLIDALAPICTAHDVFAQTGTSGVRPPCPHEPFLGYDETLRRIREADVVVTHGGNTVRLVQRAGKIPIAVAREARRGEMRNDHQVHYLRAELTARRVVSLDGPLTGLADAVAQHPRIEARLLRIMAPLALVDDVARAELVELLDRESRPSPAANPFAAHPLARYGWAFEQLIGRTGHHLDLGIGDATFLRTLHRETSLKVVGAEPHLGYLRQAKRAEPGLRLVAVSDRLPFCDEAFDSVTMLDVLEHTSNERDTLDEVHRVLRPGGLLVLTVPARHLFSGLDPDNAKFRFPRLHRAVYSARFGADVYRRRFIDDSDGLRGDMAWDRDWHTNYLPADMLALLDRAGFLPRRRDGANLFWRFLQVPALLAPQRVRGVFDAPLRADARRFARANLFLTAERKRATITPTSPSG